MNRIQFTLPDVGLREIEGLVWTEDDYLVLEIKSKLLGLVDEEKETIKIEFSALNDLFIQRRLFKDRLVIVPKNRELLDMVPGNHANELRLRIWNKHRRRTQLMVNEFHGLEHRINSAR